MWFFIVTLMVIGAFFCGMIVACIFHRQDLVLHDSYLKELKVITDALRNPSCPPRPLDETPGFNYIPGIPMPDPFLSSPPTITCEDK